MPPTIKPLPGYTYEGRNGESNGENILVASGITIGFATIAVLLRTYVKARIVSLFGLEDYLVIFALLCAIARFIMFVLLVNGYQLGQHIWDIALPNINIQYTWDKGAAIIYLIAILCAKVSILVFYKRLFGVSRPFRFACYFMAAVIVGYCFALIFANIFQCNPIFAGWNFFAPGACASLVKINIAIGAFNVATDFLLVVLPIPLILGLQLQPAKMVGLLLILATGFFVVAVAIIREVQTVSLGNTYDSTWNEGARELWISVELNIGILCACLPVLSPLGKKFPGKDYFSRHYHSMVSLLRGSRGTNSQSRSRERQPGSDDHLELMESGKADSKVRGDPTFRDHIEKRQTVRMGMVTVDCRGF